MQRSILIAGLIAAGLALAGCETEEQKQAKWTGFCSTHGFTSDQCLVLYSLRKDIAADQSSAESNGLVTGMVIGGSMSSGRK